MEEQLARVRDVDLANFGRLPFAAGAEAVVCVLLEISLHDEATVLANVNSIHVAVHEKAVSHEVCAAVGDEAKKKTRGEQKEEKGKGGEMQGAVSLNEQK